MRGCVASLLAEGSFLSCRFLKLNSIKSLEYLSHRRKVYADLGEGIGGEAKRVSWSGREGNLFRVCKHESFFFMYFCVGGRIYEIF